MKAFLITLFWKQNKYHKHSVLIHTLKVTYFLLKHKQYHLFVAGLLHDIGKPVVAHQDEEDISENLGTYSFTGHEEKSYQMIKNSQLLSDNTKNVIRYHYLITGMAVDKRKYAKTNDSKYLESYDTRLKTWASLPYSTQRDLFIFKIADDLGKGFSKNITAIPEFLENDVKLVKNSVFGLYGPL